MRRFLIFAIGLVIVVTGIYAWWLLRPTPEKVLAQALEHLASDTSVQQLQGVLYWDLIDPSGQGYVLDTWLSYAGSLNVADPTHPQADGKAVYSASTRSEDYQTADVVLTKDQIAFQLRETNDGLRAWVKERAPTSTDDAWFSLGRDAVLQKEGYDEWVSIGNGTDIRNALLDLGASAWASLGSVSEEMDAGTRVLRVELLPNERAIEQGLVSLLAAWKLKNPDREDLAWAARSARGIASGKWNADIDLQTKRFHRLAASWPLVDDAGRTVGHVTLNLSFRGFGGTGETSEVPEGALDLTSTITTTRPSSFSPASERVIETIEPEEESVTGTGREGE